MLRLSFVVEIPIGRTKNSMQVRRWNDSSQSLHAVHFILTRAGLSNLWLQGIWWPRSAAGILSREGGGEERANLHAEIW